MYLLYVDESGDTGFKPTSSPYFILSGLAVHEYDWPKFAKAVYLFRRRMKQHFDFDMRAEIHATNMIARRFGEKDLPRHVSFNIIRYFARELAKLNYVRTFSVVARKVDFPEHTDLFTVCWKRLLSIFEEAIDAGTLPRGNKNRCGMIFCDDTDGQKLTRIFRERQSLEEHHLDHEANTILIEDPIQRNSKHSYFIQATDIIAYLIYQSYHPNAFFREKGRKNIVRELAPISLPQETRPGIVELVDRGAG